MRYIMIFAIILVLATISIKIYAPIYNKNVPHSVVTIEVTHSYGITEEITILVQTKNVNSFFIYRPYIPFMGKTTELQVWKNSWSRGGGYHTICYDVITYKVLSIQ